MKKLKIAGLSNQDTGVFNYRILQPLRGVAKQKLATVHHMPYWGQHVTHFTSKEFIDYFALEGKWADVVFSTAACDRHYLSLLWGMKEQYGFKLVIDVDDDILATHTEPNNPAYISYINQDARYAEYFQMCVHKADLVTVSTEYLRQKMLPLNKNIVVVKNFIDPNFFSHKNKPDDVTLGFTGSGSHQGDWKMIEPTLKQLKEETDCKVKMLGPMQTTVCDEQTKWVDQLKHPKTLADMGFSIGLAPLKDSLMNRAKSNLRWLEYSAMKIPTVASDTLPFREMENVIRVNEPEEWHDSLSTLIHDKSYREKLGKQAYEEMRTNYDGNEQSRILFNAINSL